MKPFHFTLEAVGTVRRRQEQKAMEKYAQALVAQRQSADALQAAERELGLSMEELRAKLAGGCTGAAANQAQVYLRAAAQRRDDAGRALDAADRRVNDDWQNMLAARQQREIVDKYYDRQKASHQQDQSRDEQKILDELAGRRGSSILAWKAVEAPL